MARLGSQTIDASKLDSLFDVALVLLGILAAAELQYVTAIPLPTDESVLQGLLNLRNFTFRATTIPFIFPHYLLVNQGDGCQEKQKQNRKK